jgi:repressor of nif and glnA expression
MLWSRSQLNENTQGDFSIIQQISALRRENRFLKVGLIFCLVLSAMPYLTGFQPETISAKRVVTERIEFVSDGEKVASIVVHPKKTGLVIEDRNANDLLFLGKELFGGMVGVYNKDGRLVASMTAEPLGGFVRVNNNDGKLVWSAP